MTNVTEITFLNGPGCLSQGIIFSSFTEGAGGLFWSSARDYKNVITNELYLATSGYLYDVTQDTQYLTNLKNTWEWFNASAMRGSNGLYNDGLTKDGLCANNGQTQWTYNQGVVLAGLGFLYKYTQDESATTTAWSIMELPKLEVLYFDGSIDRNYCESEQVLEFVQSRYGNGKGPLKSLHIDCEAIYPEEEELLFYDEV
ncbi:uncharacterized protein BT62DRAFT_935568 [Guyanagaster necrorhizus]|uniref:Uncharacterized protein n=1 Tax=Guyanagaster necrorhizus TaxID=856835 RepID=A0A9P8APD6_9AGAR|nr:uncharacterized protein BT62DRAFT_935568 [Guyanagaster necrorhizus MCA 3950]KAG7442835.1 hypothetical protein BT62DRAFT_935568 [Guyanagaster necrorhizus MCA 3950]